MNDSGSSTPPGWYPDGQGGQRWWDGTQWGPVGQPPAAQVSPPTTPMPTSPPPSSPPSSAPQYGAYAPPSSPPPGQGQPGSSRKNPKLLLGIVGGLVGLAVLIVVLVLVLGGGSGASSDDPAETVSSFFDAARDGDCDAAIELLTQNARDTFQAEDCDAGDPTQDFADASVDVGEPQVDGDDASVPVSVSDESGALGVGEVTITFELVKADDVWLIDGIGFDDLLGDLSEELPSDINPDDLLSDLPSDFDPEDFLSDLPSDFDPEDFLSDLPSDFNPEDFLSDLPSDFLSDFPTE